MVSKDAVSNDESLSLPFGQDVIIHAHRNANWLA